jgi:hypothetical protein
MDNEFINKEIKSLNLKQQTGYLYNLLREEFNRAKESYLFESKANTINKDWDHIIPLSFLTSISSDPALLLSIVTDRRNIVLIDTSSNRSKLASIDLSLIPASKESDFISFLKDLKTLNFKQDTFTQDYYLAVMNIIESFLSKNDSNYNKTEFPKLKNYIIQFNGPKLNIDDFTFRQILTYIDACPSISYYLQIFNLSPKQIGQLVKCNACFMLLKYFNLDFTYFDHFNKFCNDFTTLPNLMVMYLYLENNKGANFADQYMSDFLKSQDVNDLNIAITNSILSLSDMKSNRTTDLDIDQAKYSKILNKFIQLY